MDDAAFEELLQTAEVKDFFFRAERELFPNISSSAIVISVYSRPDAKFALEVGAAVLFNKPMVLIVSEGLTPARKILAIADEVVYISSRMTDRDKEMVKAAILRVLPPR